MCSGLSFHFFLTSGMHMYMHMHTHTHMHAHTHTHTHRGIHSHIHIHAHLSPETQQPYISPLHHSLQEMQCSNSVQRHIIHSSYCTCVHICICLIVRVCV